MECLAAKPRIPSVTSGLQTSHSLNLEFRLMWRVACGRSFGGNDLPAPIGKLIISIVNPKYPRARFHSSTTVFQTPPEDHVPSTTSATVTMSSGVVYRSSKVQERPQNNLSIAPSRAGSRPSVSLPSRAINDANFPRSLTGKELPLGPYNALVHPKIKKERRVPSEASGGVPEPTRAYLHQATIPSTQLAQPRKILVLVDLNGTLLFRPNKKNPGRLIERPYAKTFLDYCIRTFTVVIWSSAKPQNVQKMVQQLLTPEQREKVVAVWGRDTLGLSPADYNERVQCYKRLETIWDNPGITASHPEAKYGKKWDQTNTVLVDDSVEKARSQPFNSIAVPEFDGDITEEAQFILPQVHDFLNECAQQSDVSAYIKQKPFQLRADFTLGPQ